MHDYFVHSPVCQVSSVNNVLICLRAIDFVDPTKCADNPARLAELAQDVAVQIELVKPAFETISAVKNLVGSGCNADCPRTANVSPLLQERAVVVKDLDAAIFAVAHVDVIVVVDCDRVGSMELSRRGSSCSPSLHKVAVFVEFRHPRVAIAIGDKHVSMRVPGYVR